MIGVVPMTIAKSDSISASQAKNDPQQISDEVRVGITADEQLSAMLGLAGHGDVGAFADFYDATVHRAYGLAFRVIRDSAQAEDVVQEAYLKIWLHGDRFDQKRGTGRAWLLMLVHRSAVDRVRSSQSRFNREEKHQRIDPVARSRSLDPTHDTVEASIGSIRLHAALARLGPEKHEALQLAYFGGFTYVEVARVTGVPVGTAKSRIRQGLMDLRFLLSHPH